MACTKPMIITDKKTNELIQVPCGMCIDCRLSKSRDWAVRCMHEASLYDYNSWLTLTYNDQNLPDNGSLEKRDLTLFIKRLRKRYSEKEIRYYACGEYGRTGTIRPHYHICLFNHDFFDKYFWSKSPTGYPVYRSETLESIWTAGHSTLGELTMETAGYTARYIMKKQFGPHAKFYYEGLEPEYTVMSRRPGIGRRWIEKYLSDVYPKDYFTLNGEKYSPPRYYDQYLEQVNPHLYARTKWRRNENIERQEKEKGIIDSKRLYDKRIYRECVTKSLKRTI
jgi:hypothetical protein